MPQPNIDVKDANGVVVNVNTINDNGRAVAAESQPVTFSDEDLAALTAITTALTAGITVNAGTDLNTSGLALEAGGNLAALLAKFTLGNGTSTAALRVTLSTDSSGQVKLATGASTIGKLGANDGVDIGDVTLNNVTLPLPTGASTEAKQDTIITHVDGIETQLTAANASLDAIEASAAAGATAANQATIITHIDGVETQLTAANTSLDNIEASVAAGATAANQATIITHIDGLEALLTTISASTTLLDDIVLEEDAAHASGDKGVQMLAVRADVPAARTTNDGDYTSLTTDLIGQLRVVDALAGSGTIDTFGHLITGQRNNQIDVQFYRDTPANLETAGVIDVTLVGSGSATQSGGGAVFATGATATSSSKAVSFATTYYSSGGEIYAQFTAAFPTVGAASSYMRIGLYNTTNGMFLGYEAATFGITTRTNSVDTQVAKASFNVDTLTGAAGSRFTRNGVPEAINLTYANVFRVRFGWLGEAPIVWEVLSPDGAWVAFHIIKQPNTSAAPSIANPELPMTVDVAKTSGATNYSIITYCWGAGCTLQQRRATDALTTGTIMPYSRAILAGETTAGGGSLINIKVNPSGSVQVGGTVEIDQTTPGTTNGVSVAQIGGTTVVNGGTAGTLGVGGVQAHDAADSNNKPVKVGAQARSTEAAAVSSADICNLVTDLVGKLIVLPYANPENFVSGVTAAMTGTTSTSLIAAPGAGLRNYITSITVSNTHASVGTDINIQDGSGGTTIWVIPAASVYGGAVITFPTPLKQPTANTALYCANATTGASTRVSAAGYKGA